MYIGNVNQLLLKFLDETRFKDKVKAFLKVPPQSRVHFRSDLSFFQMDV